MGAGPISDRERREERGEREREREMRERERKRVAGGGQMASKKATANQSALP